MSNKFLKGVELNEGVDQGYFIPNLTGNGPPSESTQGAVGSQYIDTNTGYIYKCTAVNDGIDGISYMWKTNALIVTVNQETGKPSHTVAEMNEHAKNGGTVLVDLTDYAGGIFQPVQFGYGGVYISHTSDENYLYTYIITDDGVEQYEFDFLTSQHYQQLKNLIVTLKSDLKASHTPEQIWGHIVNGGSAYLLIDNAYLPIVCLGDAELCYAYYIGDDGLGSHYCIETDGTVSTAELNYASAHDVETLKEQMGDIETALDSIIAIQNELIGGDA